MRPFLAELRRRNVYKVGAAYAVVAWILIQVASILLPTFGAPSWVLRVVTFLVILGFPLALVFAWAFELTPDGLRRTHEVRHEHSITHHTKRKLDFGIIALLVVALGISAWFNLRGPRAGARAASIAVLPFTSRSVDPGHAMFADGIHDELLTSLAQIGSLKVISRTSVMEYRDTTKNLREIGEELAVSTVLEGAVQRSGDNVRINVQLIDAETDEHLWANSYDRRLSTDNLFAIQTEIATAIAGKLQATLTPDERERINRVPTGNLQAYNLYLAGRQNLYQRKLENLQRARELFEQVIELDPAFAKAYSALSDTLNILYVNFDALEPDEVIRESQTLLDKALALDPGDADVQASVGLLAGVRWDVTGSPAELAAAEQAFERAIALNRNHAQAIAWYAGRKADGGKNEEAIVLLERALQLDPLARVSQLNLGEGYAGVGEHRKALDTWLECMRLNPDWPAAPEMIGLQLADLGRLDEALAWNHKARALSSDPTLAVGAIGIYRTFGLAERVADLARELPREHSLWALRQAVARHAEGDTASGLALLEDAIAQSGYVAPRYLDVAAELAVLQGKSAEARGYIERRCPQLTEPVPKFDYRGPCGAAIFALVLQRQGESRRASEVLEAYLEFVAGRPRLGRSGFGIEDVESLAILGRSDEALVRLREAIDDGWRAAWWRVGWGLADSPHFAGLRDDPRFRAMVAEVDADIARMRRRAAQAEASGDWQPLLVLAEQGEGRGATASD